MRACGGVSCAAAVHAAVVELDSPPSRIANMEATRVCTREPPVAAATPALAPGATSPAAASAATGSPDDAAVPRATRLLLDHVLVLLLSNGFSRDAAHVVDLCRDTRGNAALWARVVDVPRGDRDMTRLQKAALDGDVPRVHAALDRGANPAFAVKEAGGFHALHYAAFGGHVAATAALCARGAPVDGRNTGDLTALMVASDGGHVGVVRELLDRGARVDARTVSGIGALHMAASHGHTDAIALLIAADADVNARCRDSQTPLMQAVRAPSLTATSQLLAAGADVHVRTTQSGLTALHWAAGAGSADCIRALVAAGAALDVVSRQGDSALAIALWPTPGDDAMARGRAACVVALLSAGARR